MPVKSSNKPQTHCGNLARLPSPLAPLTEEKRFAVWSWEPREGKDGEWVWTKPPRQPRNLQFAKSNDPSTWSTYEQALRRRENGDVDGVGYMLLGSNIGASDLDHCCKRDAKDTNGKDRSMGTGSEKQSNGAYCEVTPSGEGLRLIGTVAGEELHCSFKVENAHPDAKIEFYRKTARFITITGLMLGDCAQLSPFDDFMELAVARYDRNGPERSVGTGSTNTS